MNNETINLVNGMKVVRYQIDPIVDFKIHGISPVENVPVLLDAYGLNIKRT